MSRAARVIFVKELRETLRDRRTVVLMILLPIVLYPALLLLVTQVAGVQQAKLEAQTARVGVIGAAPTALEAALGSTDGIERVPVESAEAVRDGAADAVLTLEEGFAARIDAGLTGRATVTYDETSERSKLAKERLDEVLSAYRASTLDARLQQRGIKDEFVRPLEVTAQNAAQPTEMGGFLLAQIVPIFLVLTVILGAFYPAVDLTAGEKERGTIQTLLTAPVRSIDIVTGKFMAVCVIAFLAGLFNIGSVVLFFSQASALTGGRAAILEISLPLGTVALLFATVVVMGLFFSALMMTVAVLARSFKEAQHYLTPVYLASVIPAVIAQLPGMELGPMLALVPAVNVSLLLKALLSGDASADAVFLVLASTVVYTAMVLTAAARLFRSAHVMLGETTGFSPLVRSADGPSARRALPSPGEALALFGVVFVLLYYVGAWLQVMSPLPGVALTLWGILLPATLVAVRVLRLSPRATLLLRRPSAASLLGATLMGLGAWAIVSAVVLPLQQSFLPIPKELVESMQDLLAVPEGPLGVLLLVLVFAVTPGVCEELLFRGFVLSGLSRGVRPLWAVLLTAVLFGVLHLSVHRFLGTFALGAVAGLVAVRSASIVPAMVFHAVNNGALLLASQLSPEWGIVDPASGTPSVAVTVACGAVLLVGLALLLRGSERSRPHELESLE